MAGKILITGENSYVGSSFIKWMSKHEPGVECVEISVRGEEWKSSDFSEFDSVLHVAGIAHVNSKVFKPDDYYRVNTELTIEVARKAKSDGVPHFIFMSSMIVYNDSDLKDGMITIDTVPSSKNAYGNSKIKAENGLKLLEDNDFNIAILRPPMIYGPGAKGNYSKLAKLAKITPIFPNYSNKRSMLFINNLSIFINHLVQEKSRGLFFPQNEDYVCTSDLVREISLVHKKRVLLVYGFNWLIKIASNNSVINKVFGNLYYDKSLSNLGINYNVVNGYKLRQSLIITERK